MRVAENDRLPVAPLLDFILTRGGWAEVAEQAALRNGEGARETMKSRKDRWEANGWVSAYVVDEIMTGLYGVHPYCYYHNEWWAEHSDAERKIERMEYRNAQQYKQERSEAVALLAGGDALDRAIAEHMADITNTQKVAA